MKKTKFLKISNFVLAAMLCIGMLSCKKVFTPPAGSPSQTNLPAPNSAWVQLTSLPNEKMIALETSGNTVYAASASGNLYISADNGATWAKSVVSKGIEVTSLAIFNNKIYIGTYANGIYTSSNNGSSWTVQAAQVSPVSTFTIWNGNLYAGCLYYNGIFILDNNSGNWGPFVNSGLPTNYSTDVEKLVAVNNTLVSAQGPNGTFYTYNSSLNQWKEGYYFSSTYSPGVRIQDIMYDQRTLFASTGSQVISSNNGGANWSYDTVGLKIEPLDYLQKQRVLYATGSKDYILSNVHSPTGTWVQYRDKTATAGTTWVKGETFLQLPDNSYTYDIRELNNMLFVATDNGVYCMKE